jgi:hypothetical protein
MSLPLFAENVKLELKHPVSGESTGLVLELIPLDHDTIHDAKVGALKSLRARKLTDTADVLIDLPTKIDVLASAIAGWEVQSDAWHDAFVKVFGFTDESFTADKARSLLAHPKSAWIRAQIDTALADTERFFPMASN